ncbi:MAG TPA: glycosyltransferase [Promineifilum sp.]|nr:glycosyltransferase [Promineifilum sp.]
MEANAATLPADLQAWYRPYPYLHEEMGAAFRAADLALARAGASMLGESPAFGLPAILVPLTFAWRYQKVNADYLTERGAAVQLIDETLAETLLPTVQDLLFDSNKLAQMATAATMLDRPDAATDLAQVIRSEAKPEKKPTSTLPQEETSC